MIEVYQDCVEASLTVLDSANALLYVNNEQSPSWTPRWNLPMLFRNPFRFGRSVPWRPVAGSKPQWRISKEKSVLSLSGGIIDRIRRSATYNQAFFGEALYTSETGRQRLEQAWSQILEILADNSSQSSIATTTLTAAAVSLSFGVDEKSEEMAEARFAVRFVAYLRKILGKTLFDRYIPADLATKGSEADGGAFGKPVWDFEYPESSIFVTESGLVGCCIAPTGPGDVVFVAPGCTYPLILRNEDDHFLVRGYAFVHGMMLGERQNFETTTVNIH